MNELTPNPRFVYFEVVEVQSTPETLRLGYAGSVGAVLGIGENGDGSYGYAVALDGREEAVDFAEEELAATGEHRSREDYYSGDVLRIDHRGRVLDGLRAESQEQ